MNRLIIIGNGFDLAHGLPTRYRDFIDDYWRDITKDFNLINKCFLKNHLIEVNYEFLNGNLVRAQDEFKKISSFSGFEKFIKKYESGYNQYQYLDKNDCSLTFINQFFKIICNISTENWVEIENVYYDILKNISNGNFNKHNYPWGISQLNKEFEQVKNLLEKYLVDKVVNKYDLDFTKNQDIDWMKMYKVLKPISLSSREDNILMEFVNPQDVKEIEEQFEKERKEELDKNLYFLNFNYSPIASIYRELFDRDDSIQSRMNFIHGSLGNVLENKINFGFGDEMDDDYKMIEKLDDNEYLKNFKSFQYLQNSNYNDFLRFIDSEKFQVCVLGHSCGLSDRTLLNTIFEHNNCRSIKVFYHQKEDGTDNYTEITQNISRHFNKKKLMREKIVNKTLCQPLPQIQLPLK